MSFLPLSHSRPSQPHCLSSSQPPEPPQPPPSLLPSALADSSTLQLPAEEPPTSQTKIEEEIPAEAPTTSTLLPRPSFSPFFTLLTTTSTTTSSPSPHTSAKTHHPNITYIFSDDPTSRDPITAAALEILDPFPHHLSPTTQPPSPTTTSPNGVKERYILVDMDPTGTKVLQAQSMSPEWAVLSTEVGEAPSWDDRGGGLMLRVEGCEVPKEEDLGLVGMEVGEEGKEREKRLEELVGVYERRMEELRRVVDAGAGAEVGEGKEGG